MLVCAVVIHHPDFFGAGAGTDEGDLGGSDSGQAAGKFADNFVGELMGELANLRIGGSAAINFANHGLRRRIADVIEPCFDGDFGGRLGEITKTQEICVCGGIDPNGRFQFGRYAGGLRRIETGASEFEDAAELEIVADNLSEKRSVGFRRIGARGEVGDGQARFIGVHADRGPKPILGRCRVRNENEEGENKK